MAVPDTKNPSGRELGTVGSGNSSVRAEQPVAWKNPRVLTSAGSGVLLLFGWLAGLIGVPPDVSAGVYLVAIGTGGYFFGREALEELLFQRRVGIELLMSTAAVAAALLGLPGEGAMLVFLYSITEAAEDYTEEKTRSAIRALMDLAPKTALVKRDGQVEIPVEELQVGDVFIVRPGESLATDGVVIEGTSSVNQAPVTGESVPVEKQPGQSVFAGTINGQGVLEVRATKAFADNTLARIIQMIEEAQERKGTSQRLIERFGLRYSPAVLLAGILLALAPPLIFGAEWSPWLTRATVFIVAAAPCALVVSVPITLVASLGTSARRGVLIKGGVYLERLAKVSVVALDKTGTLTYGQPEVTDVSLLPNMHPHCPATPQELLAVAAGVESLSEHPLALAIVQYAERLGIESTAVQAFQALPGAGASARWNGSTVYVGNPALFEERLGLSRQAQDAIAPLQEAGNTVVLIGDKHGVWGIIAIRDNLRSNAASAIDGLRAIGVEQVVMLTGDNAGTAQAIAREAGIDEFYADLKPEDKVTKVRRLRERYGHVAMVGDGVNDAPALAEAAVGVAMGAAGTDVALETADVALMADDLQKLVYALQLSSRNQRVVSQNVLLSILVVVVLVVGALADVFSLPVAVIGHEVSELAVVANGLRMLRA